MTLVGVNTFAAISPRPGGWYFLLYVALTLTGVVLLARGVLLRIKSSRGAQAALDDRSLSHTADT